MDTDSLRPDIPNSLHLDDRIPALCKRPDPLPTMATVLTPSTPLPRSTPTSKPPPLPSQRRPQSALPTPISHLRPLLSTSKPPRPFNPLSRRRHQAPVARRRVSKRLPTRLLPKWLPPSALDWSDADEDDADVYRRIYFRRKTDAEMQNSSQLLSSTHVRPLSVDPASIPSSLSHPGRSKTHSPPSGTSAEDGLPASAVVSSTVGSQAQTRVRARAASDQAEERRDRALHGLSNQGLNAAGSGSAVNTRKRTRNVSQQLDHLGGASVGLSGASSTAVDMTDEQLSSTGRRLGVGSRGSTNGSVVGGSTGGRDGEGSRSEERTSKKARAGLSSGVGGKSGVNKSGAASRLLFEKHEGKKGWLVCKACRTAVWPPNCLKHISNCSEK